MLYISGLIKNYMFVQKIFNKAVDALMDPAYKPAPDGANDGTNRSKRLC